MEDGSEVGKVVGMTFRLSEAERNEFKAALARTGISLQAACRTLARSFARYDGKLMDWRERKAFESIIRQAKELEVEQS